MSCTHACSPILSYHGGSDCTMTLSTPRGSGYPSFLSPEQLTVMDVYVNHLTQNIYIVLKKYLVLKNKEIL